MSIKFFCGCGNHLKARDEMAGRRAMCPKCGSPVGIPSLRPTHPGTAAAPLTPEERRRLARQRGLVAEGPAPPPATPSPAAVALEPVLAGLFAGRKARPRRGSRHLEK